MLSYCLLSTDFWLLLHHSAFIISFLLPIPVLYLLCESHRRTVPRSCLEESAVFADSAHLRPPARDALQHARAARRRHALPRPLRGHGRNRHRGTLARRYVRHLR